MYFYLFCFSNTKLYENANPCLSCRQVFNRELQVGILQDISVYTYCIAAQQAQRLETVYNNVQHLAVKLST